MHHARAVRCHRESEVGASKATRVSKLTVTFANEMQIGELIRSAVRPFLCAVVYLSNMLHANL